MDVLTGSITPLPLELTDEATQRLIELDGVFERSLGRGGDNEAICEMANKALQHLVRLAGVMAIYEGSARVSREGIDRARMLVDFYLNEWKTIATKVGASSPEIPPAKRLLAWLKEYVIQNPGLFRLRIIYSKGPREFSGRTDFTRNTLVELVRRGYVRPVGDQYEMRPDDVE